MEFLVNIEIALPDGLDPHRADELRAAERERAAELARAGVLVRLWRAPGRWANWGLWRAAGEPDLREALGSLPMYPYMSVQIHPLDPHPNDPARTQP
ncbi:muconolactone delta-isomerase [Actinomadura sp. KC216]|uniref:muconolactone Delta-isomerase n=1 Tax=Actinomadura sp. KC216 TaxID=2530370 RepID=UPI0010519283|nr:muconolactone Delta-isomerase family protein [Actinomadura sp. KC216]TDB85915.1 muconolactone delta-isomerase [Actinomadura sp. KC216]